MSPLKVWSRFAATKRDGSEVKLRIQDAPSERYEDVMDFNVNYFVKYENIHIAAGIPKNPEALQECREFVSEMMRDSSHHIAICCLDDDTDTVSEILGVSTMSYTTKDEDFDMDDLQFKTEEMKKYFELIEDQFTLYDVMEQQNLEKCFDGRGVAVHPDYRGLGIATEFLKARLLTCKEKAVPATWAWMNALGSQKAAARAGWQIIYQIPFQELGDRLGVTFEGAPELCKLMIARV